MSGAPLPPEVAAALADGRKIDAIRLLREQTGLGLAEAKAAVETGELPAGAGRATAAAGDEPLPPAAIAALADGRFIDAVGATRRHFGIGLKDAKDRVDRHVAATRGPRTGDAVQRVGGGGLRAVGVLLLVIVLAGLYALLA